MRVLVIGSGLIGVSSAYFLAQAGASVTVLDREAAPAQGTSFANSGMLTPSMADPWNAPGVLWHLLRDFGRGHAPLRLRRSGIADLLGWGPAFIRHSAPGRYRANLARNLHLARFSLDTLRELRSRLALAYDQRTAGTLRVYRDAASLAASAARWDALGALGVKPRRLTADEVVALEPALAAVRPAIIAGMHCEEDESGDARLFTEALARHARAQGVCFLQSEVTGFTRRGGRIDAALTAQGPLEADAFVLAAGCWSPQLLAPLGLKLPLRPVKGYSVTLQPGALAPFPQRPVIDDTLHVAVTPLGTRLRVAGLAEFAGYDRRIPDERLDTLLGFLRRVYPAAAPGHRGAIQPWAGLRPVSADGVPFIGRLRYDNLYLNTGQGHLGWTLAAGSGRLLAQLLMGTPPALDAGAYDPQRRI